MRVYDLVDDGTIRDEYPQCALTVSIELAEANELLVKYHGYHTTGKDVHDLITKLKFYKK